MVAAGISPPLEVAATIAARSASVTAANPRRGRVKRTCENPR